MIKKHILVWMPLSPGSKWRGEGIAQTVESWLLNAGNEFYFHILVNEEAAIALEETLADRVSCKIYNYQSFGIWKKPSKKSYSPEETFKKLKVFDYFIAYFHKLTSSKKLKRSIVQLVGYALLIRALTSLVNLKIIFRQIEMIWIPTPSIPFVESLRGKIAYNFWDPFVMEYSEFNSVASVYAAKFMGMYSGLSDSSLIITQSNANKNYLTNVMGVAGSKIHVVRLGCPDYSLHLSKIITSNKILEFKKSKFTDIYKYYPVKTSIEMTADYHGRRLATEYFERQTLSCSKFYRLCCNLESESKIILISTQNRPYKGLALAFEVMVEVFKKIPKYKLHIITTCEVPDEVKRDYPELYESIIELSRIPNANHAFITAISDLIVHPSFVEGGYGSYSMFEAASVDVPSLTNTGRHTRELCNSVGTEIEVAFSDFSDIKVTADRIYKVLTDKNTAQKIVNAVKNGWYAWSDSSAKIKNAFNMLIEK